MDRTTLTRLTALAGAVLLTGSTLALGSVHWQVLAAVAMALGGLLVVARGAFRLRMEAGAWLLLGLSSFTWLQCAPLPPALVGSLSPAAHAVWSDAYALSGARLQWIPLSIEPQDTRVEALKWLIYAAAWMLVVGYVRNQGLRWVLAFVFSVGLLGALVAGVHAGLELERPYGFYEVRYAKAARIAPLLNPNNLAGLFNLSALVGLAWVVRLKFRWPLAAFALAGVAILLSASLLTGSRGGAIALGLGLVLAVVVLARGAKRRAAERTSWQALTLVAATIAAGGIFFWLALVPGVRAELTNLSLEKVTLWRWSGALLREHWLVGLGRGAMGAELSRFRPSEGNSAGAGGWFTHAENFALEWMAGWGVFVGGLALLALGAALVRIWRESRQSPSDRIVWCAILTLLFQNLFDLGTEVAGVMLPFVVVLGGLWASNPARVRWPERAEPRVPLVGKLAADAPMRRRSGDLEGELAAATPPRREDRRPRRKVDVLVPAVVAAACLTAALGALISPPLEARVERRDLAALARNEPPAAVFAAAREALNRHPGDAFVLRVGALAAGQIESPETVKWINASLRRDPSRGRVYLLLAELLHSAGRLDQALVALRAAAEREHALARRVAQRAYAWAPDSFERAIPDGEAGDRVLEQLMGLVPGPEQVGVAEQRLQRQPTNAVAHASVARTLLDAVEKKHAPCEGEVGDCLVRAGKHVAQAEDYGSPLEAVELWARLELARGNAAEAHRRLLERCPRNREGSRCLAVLMQAAAAKLTLDEQKQAARLYLDASCTSSDRCVAAERRVGSYFNANQAHFLALEHYQRAANLSSNPRDWLTVARLAARVGRVPEGLRALQKAERATADLTDAERQAIASLRQQLRRVIR